MESNSSEMISGLSRLEPGYLPLDIFIEVARLTVTPVVEVVPLVNRERGVGVLLTKRSDNDPIWPGMWHTPGTVIRAYDNSIDDGINRLLRDELDNCHNQRPEYVGHLLHQVRRGTELALIHWVTVHDNIQIGRPFYPDNLPDNLVDSQRGFIAWAVNTYLESRRYQS